MAEIIQLRRDRSTSWARINPILAQGEIGYELDTNQFKIGDGRSFWSDLPYFASVDSIQVEEMPELEPENLGKIYQYVGLSNQNYVNGYFYKHCSETIEVDKPSLVLQDGQTFEIYDMELLETRVSEQHDVVKMVVTKNDSNINIRIDYYNEAGTAFSFTTTTLIDGVSEYMGFRFVGITTVNNNTHVELYPTPEGWRRIDVQPTTEVINSLTSTSTTSALSAYQGRELQDQINNLSSIGRFLAMWDADTGVARYVDLGFQYEQGDYFIIASVDEPDMSISAHSSGITATVVDQSKWEEKFGVVTRSLTFTKSQYGWEWSEPPVSGSYQDVESEIGVKVEPANASIGESFTVAYNANLVNYMPEGGSYTGPSQTVATDPIEISDMYFYTGSQWVYLANHQKQTAVDEALSASSTNPVENRVVTNALADKVNSVNTSNSIYATDDGGNQTTLSIGSGLTIQNGAIVNTRTSAVWGNITGDIENQGDLIDYIAEHGGGSGGEGIGTLNLSNVFCKPADLITPDWEENRADQYKGDYRHIFFTVNADLDYIKQNREDIYITYSRRNRGDNLRKFRILDDNRKGVNIKMHCWRVPTHRYFNSTYETFDYDYNDNYHNDINYEYFYTADNYGDDVKTLLENNPYAFYSDLRKEGDSYEDDNYSCGNWGTCLNELQNGGPLSDLYEGREASLKEVERCEKYDISEIAMDTDIIWDPDEDNVQWLYRMKGRLYKDSDGHKFYTWSHEWYFDDQTGEVFAYLDDNDDPIANRVPEDKSLIRSLGTEQELIDAGWTLVEERPDLTYWYFPSNSLMEVERFVQHCRNCTKNCSDQSGNMDMNWRCYFWDYPIVPVRISQCKIFFADEAPHVYNEGTGEWENDYSDRYYVNHAFSLEEIENDPGLQQMLSYQKQLIFVYPYDTHYLWMRTFGWQKTVYTHVYRESQWHEDEEYYDPWIQGYQYHWEYDEEYDRYSIVPDYDPETGEIARENIVLWAKPWDRHNLMRGMFLGGQRNLGYGDRISMNSGMGDLDNKMGKIQGGKYPKWSMRHGSVYLQPIEFNIASGREVSFGFTSKSTPFEVQLRISGEGGQNVYR